MLGDEANSQRFSRETKTCYGYQPNARAISSRFWILSAREVIRDWENECAECRRRKAKAAEQVMAPWSLARVKTSLRAFTRTSVDFGGAFVTIKGRGKRRQKRYLRSFTCMATRAVQLEMVYGLDTDSFLNAFYRMSSRRGLPVEFFSDNGTNFKSADKELKSLLDQLDRDKIGTHSQIKVYLEIQSTIDCLQAMWHLLRIQLFIYTWVTDSLHI